MRKRSSKGGGAQRSIQVHLMVDEEEEHDSPTVQALREIEYQLRRIGRNVNQIAHNANREMNATIGDEASASYAVRQCRELVARLDSIIDQSGNG